MNTSSWLAEVGTGSTLQRCTFHSIFGPSSFVFSPLLSVLFFSSNFHLGLMSVTCSVWKLALMKCHSAIRDNRALSCPLHKSSVRTPTAERFSARIVQFVQVKCGVHFKWKPIIDSRTAPRMIWLCRKAGEIRSLGVHPNGGVTKKTRLHRFWLLLFFKFG